MIEMTTEVVAARPGRVGLRDRLRPAGERVLRVARATPAVVARVVGAGWTLAAQLLGAGAALAGVYVLLGLGVTLLVGGLGLAAVGTLAEMVGKPKAGG